MLCFYLRSTASLQIHLLLSADTELGPAASLLPRCLLRECSVFCLPFIN